MNTNRANNNNKRSGRIRSYSGYPRSKPVFSLCLRKRGCICAARGCRMYATRSVGVRGRFDFTAASRRVFFRFEQPRIYNTPQLFVVRRLPRSKFSAYVNTRSRRDRLQRAKYGRKHPWYMKLRYLENGTRSKRSVPDESGIPIGSLESSTG